MNLGVDPNTLALVSLALDAASLRHQAIANNLANANSADYVPLRVNFEEQLDALRAVANTPGPLPASALAGVQPFVERDDAYPAGSVASAIDMEVVRLTQNTVHYQALLRALGKQMAIMQLAVNEGRR